MLLERVGLWQWQIVSSTHTTRWGLDQGRRKLPAGSRADPRPKADLEYPDLEIWPPALACITDFGEVKNSY